MKTLNQIINYALIIVLSVAIFRFGMRILIRFSFVAAILARFWFITIPIIIIVIAIIYEAIKAKQRKKEMLDPDKEIAGEPDEQD
ncbi:MAG: hypothetical protein K8S56_04965 [Candidatus Cloacimonetes bacterium]|nr:hypothetical protein [Candidatus Cloacimonadota bacterium]